MVFEFEIEGEKHKLYFGMIASQIVAEKSIKVAFSDTESVETKLKTFAYLVYGGLCNQADRSDVNRPDFEYAYDLAMKILEQGDEMQTALFNTWAETKPAKAMLALLPKDEGKKKEETEQ